MAEFDPEAALARLEAAAERRMATPAVPEAKLKDERLTVALPPNVGAEGLVAALARLGYEPDAFQIEHVEYRQVGGADQLKVTLRPAAWSLQPARVPGPLALPPAEYDPTLPRLVVFCGDQQAPYLDPMLHELFLRWIEAARPEEVDNLGDLVNLTVIGNKHRWNPYRTPNPLEETQTCINEGYRWWREVSQAGGASLRKKIQLPGNHEQHLLNAMIEAEEGKLFGLRRAGDPDGCAAMSLRHLMRLDELGVDWIADPLGEWPKSVYRVSEWLGACHGWLIGKAPGDAARATIQRVGYSMVIGHTHTQGVAEHTVWERDGSHRVLLGCEIGGMHLLNAQGYEQFPNQQQGFATSWVYPDGTFSPFQLATYVDGHLRWGSMDLYQAHGLVRVSGMAA